MIMVRVEASYNEGLSAGLFQQSAKGWQPVHFISRSLTFAYLGVARRVTSDNGPPFNSEQFKDFAKEEGFVHHRVTPNHPRANGQVERFMQTLKRKEQIAHPQGKSGPDRNMAV